MLIHGNSQFIGLKDNSVHCCITSIPYWNLRVYNLEPVVFGGDRGCKHQWGVKVVEHKRGKAGEFSTLDSNQNNGRVQELTTGQFCRLCGAWRGELGLEPTPSLFVAHIVQIFREVKRVLHPSGTCWINIGDTYSTAQNGRSAAATKAAGNDDRTFRDKPFSSAGIEGIKNKDLCGIPWRVAFGLQDDGWYLRSAPPWVKGSPMPESVMDRPGVANEYMFLLTKSEKYFFDMDAVRMPGTDWGKRNRENAKHNTNGMRANGQSPHHGLSDCDFSAGRNLRTSDFFRSSLDAYIEHLQYVRDNGGMMLDEQGLPMAFLVNSKGYPGAHYATFPVKLVEPCILAGTSARGVCPKCGAPWKRETVAAAEYAKVKNEAIGQTHRTRNQEPEMGKQAGWGKDKARVSADYTTTGWSPTCHCNAGDPVPSVILDPFAGSGTVGEAARLHGRRFVGIDLNPSYLQINALPRAEKLTSEKAIMELPLFNLEVSANDH